jgi:enterochelin esterase family protein
MFNRSDIIHNTHYAGAEMLRDTFVALGLDRPFSDKRGGDRFGSGWLNVNAEPSFEAWKKETDFSKGQVAEREKKLYPLTPESLVPAPSVPRGTVKSFKNWSPTSDTSQFPGTARTFWVYIPQQYLAQPVDKRTPIGLCIFCDGGGFLSSGEDSSVRVTNVLDNLIHQGDLPLMAALFINPGVRPGADDLGQIKHPQSGKVMFEHDDPQRSLEYDSLTPAFASVLESEVLPVVQSVVDVSSDPKYRAICGISSGIYI